MANFDKLYSTYYELLNHDKDYEREAMYVSQTLNEFLPDKPAEKKYSILEFGSGQGKHGHLLQKQGFDIQGIELSPAMVDIAKGRGYRCVQGDICNKKLDKKFDAVISLFHVISYQTSNEKLLSAFKNAHYHLRNEGIFLFDAWYTPGVYQLKPENRIKKIENDEYKITRFAASVISYSENTVNVHYTIIVQNKRNNRIDEFEEDHLMRHFSIPEIELVCRVSGFQLNNTEEIVTKKPLDENSWAGVFICQKKET